MTPPSSIDTVEVLDRLGQPCAMLVIDEGHGPAPLLSPCRAAALVEAALGGYRRLHDPCLGSRTTDEGRRTDAAPDHARD